MHVLSNEIPAVHVSLVSLVVELKHLVQGLQSQRVFIVFLGDAFRVRPVQRNEVQQFTGVDHLALDLVAVLDQGHEVLAGSGQGLKDGVVFRLGPFDRGVIGGIDGLQQLDEGFLGSLAAAGVADTQQGLAVGFFNGLFVQFLIGHGLRLGDDLFQGLCGCHRNNGQKHRENK